jgi:hypothetical protein
MNKTLGYVLLLVIGLAIGVPIGMVIQNPQDTPLGTGENVSLIDIEYIYSDNPGLSVILKNQFTDKVLNGNVTVYQNENQWTERVDWHTDWRNGYGFAGIGCILEENKTLRIKYTENYPKETYLDRTLQWAQIRIRESLTFTFMETEELKIASVTFGTDNSTITVKVQNTGTTDVSIIAAVTVTGYGVTGGTTTSATVGKGDTATFTVTLIGSEQWSEGKSYNVELLSSKGNKFTYTDTAPA